MDNIEDTMFNFKVTNLYSGITSDHFFENEPDNEQITKKCLYFRSFYFN